MPLVATERGLFSPEGGFFIDPTVPVERAVITHGHADHARAGHQHVLATPETLQIMKLRFGDEAGAHHQALAYDTPLVQNGVRMTLSPAGHVLGSAQVLIEEAGRRTLITGDFKRREDPTCVPYEVVETDELITEATFGLPIFRHPPERDEITKLLASVAAEPERAHLVGVYPLGKCQRLLMLLRRGGWERPIYLHGALIPLTELYASKGLEMGPVIHATGVAKKELEGQIVLAPPGALTDRWTRRLPDPIVCYASGFMRIRARVRQKKVELPLVISDHADWDELTRTIVDSRARHVRVTHGLADALVYWCGQRQIEAQALEIKGYEEEEVA